MHTHTQLDQEIQTTELHCMAYSHESNTSAQIRDTSAQIRDNSRTFSVVFEQLATLAALRYAQPTAPPVSVEGQADAAFVGQSAYGQQPMQLFAAGTAVGENVITGAGASQVQPFGTSIAGAGAAVGQLQPFGTSPHAIQAFDGGAAFGQTTVAGAGVQAFDPLGTVPTGTGSMIGQPASSQPAVAGVSTQYGRYGQLSGAQYSHAPMHAPYGQAFNQPPGSDFSR